MDKITVGKFIAEQRKHLSLTQKQFAEQLGVTDKAVSRWETGKGYPDIETIEEIAKIFNVTINDVLSGRINKPEEKETAAEQNIIDALREILHIKKREIIRITVASLVFLLVLIISVPTLYFTLIPDLRSGNYVFYSDKYYSLIDERDIPHNFIFHASRSGYEGKIIGRTGIDLVRRKDYDNVIYNSEISGSNVIYALFHAEDIPTVKEALNYTVSMLYLNVSTEQKTFSDDVNKVVSYLENIQTTEPVDYFSINNSISEVISVCVDCKEFAGFYLLGDIYVCGKTVYFRPIDNMDYCYEISLEQITAKGELL